MQQQQNSRSTFYRANRPGNLNLVDESIIENTASQNVNYLSASPASGPNQFSLQNQQQFNNNNNNNSNNNANFSMQPQNHSQNPLQIPYKLHSQSSYLPSQNVVSSPQPYMTSNSVQSPRLTQQQQQPSMVPLSPSYNNYPTSYTPNRTIHTTNNNNNVIPHNNVSATPTNNPLTSPFINPPPPPPPLQYGTVNTNTNTYDQSYTPKYSPCLTSAHVINNSKTYFNFDLPHINNQANSNSNSNSNNSNSNNVPQSPTHYNKINNQSQGSQIISQQQTMPIIQNNYQHFSANISNNNSAAMSSLNNNQKNFSHNYQKMPHTPLTAVPFNTNHHQNDIHHSLSVPSSPYNFNQQQSVFQFNTTMIKNQLLSIQDDSTPNNIGENFESKERICLNIIR